MKVKSNVEGDKFKPIELTMTLESPLELFIMQRISCCDVRIPDLISNGFEWEINGFHDAIVKKKTAEILGALHKELRLYRR
jgi:hypothetical protein